MFSRGSGKTLFGRKRMTSDSVCVCLTDKFGQRAFVGKVCMDMNVTVPEYKETTEVSMEETERYMHLDLSCGQSPHRTDGGSLCEPGGRTHASVCGFAPTSCSWSGPKETIACQCYFGASANSLQES